MKKQLITKIKRKIPKPLLLSILIFICVTVFYFLLTRLGFLMPLSDLPSVLCLNSCPAEISIHRFINTDQILNSNQPLKELLKGDIDQQKISILVEKSKYKLTLFYNLKPIKSYPVVFGSNPTGDKLFSGDDKTPEGIYHILDLYPHPHWSKFIWLDYPTSQSWRKHFQAKFSGKINFFLPIGNEIGIHGVPNGQDILIDQRSNWTWGCVSLKNNDINEIYQFLKVGTLVEIIP